MTPMDRRAGRASAGPRVLTKKEREAGIDAGDDLLTRSAKWDFARRRKVHKKRSAKVRKEMAMPDAKEWVGKTERELKREAFDATKKKFVDKPKIIDTEFPPKHFATLHGKSLKKLNKHRMQIVNTPSGLDGYPNIYCCDPHLRQCNCGDTYDRHTILKMDVNWGGRKHYKPNENFERPGKKRGSMVI